MRLEALPGYEKLAEILDASLAHAQTGKGLERHGNAGEAFEDQQIVQFGEWMKSTQFNIGQVCKKALESTRLEDDKAIIELLGVINYAAGAVLILQRRADTTFENNLEQHLDSHVQCRSSSEPVFDAEPEAHDDRCNHEHPEHGGCMLPPRHSYVGTADALKYGLAHKSADDKRWR